MPRLSVWFLRASLVNFLLGVGFGALLLAQKGVSFYPPVWNLFPAHIEFLLVGWLVQLAMGVGFWIFPRFSTGLVPARGVECPVWASFGLLNIGIGLVAVQTWIPFGFFLGRLLEAGGTILYVLSLWPRVKPHGA